MLIGALAPARGFSQVATPSIHVNIQSIVLNA